MELLLAFLIGTFVVGGSGGRAQKLSRPAALLFLCVTVGVMFYSQRVL